MTSTPSQRPLQPGEAAPDFGLPAVHEDRLVSLADYRGRSTLLLGLFPGLYCPFCRRAIAQMATSSEKLKPLGIESLAVVGTELENARLYFKFRPSKMPLAADPALTTHQSYGVPRPEPTPELMSALMETRINPTGELPQPLPIPEASEALAKVDNLPMTEVDQRDMETKLTQLKGQFLIDRDGVIRWAHIECEREGLAGFGKFPSYEELLAAAQTAR
jgi:peroxiredoxin